jgi:oligo-1,6-glucosidase
MRAWWQKSVIYQIYWRSFQDSNGDGIGDLQGVIQRLDYVQELGVDVIWFNPFYGSPDIDNGYDISDYYSIMEKAGTFDDVHALLQACKERGLKVILDLVVNHTSDQHQWFKNAQDPSHPHHHYYIWKPASDQGKPPNNWRSWFEPSSWTYCASADAYYFHSFAH